MSRSMAKLQRLPPTENVRKYKIFFSIVYLRKRNNISQEHLAKKLEISQGHLSNIECGRRSPTPEILHKIAKLFGKEVDDLDTDAPVVEMAEQLLAEDMMNIYEGGEGTLEDWKRKHCLHILKTYKPLTLASETVVTQLDNEGNQVRQSVQTKLQRLGIKP